MNIKELFDYAIDDSNTDLQALIMFLVFEKKVLTMEDDTKKLDLYFLEKHNERMNKELHAYRKKMSINYHHLDFFEVICEKRTVYVLAYTELQAFNLTKRYIPKEIKPIDKDNLMEYEGQLIKLKNITRDKPRILGAAEHGLYKKISL